MGVNPNCPCYKVNYFDKRLSIIRESFLNHTQPQQLRFQVSGTQAVLQQLQISLQLLLFLQVILISKAIHPFPKYTFVGKVLKIHSHFLFKNPDKKVTPAENQ